MFTSFRATLTAVVFTAAVSAVSFGTATATNIGNQGCTPGYWKNHTQSWEEYSPQTLLKNNFTIPGTLGVPANATFLQALQGGGGPDLHGAATILLRAAVAGYLNAAHEGVGYPYRRFTDPFNIKSQVNAALASGNRQTMLALAGVLDAANNLGCPLN